MKKLMVFLVAAVRPTALVAVLALFVLTSCGYSVLPTVATPDVTTDVLTVADADSQAYDLYAFHDGPGGGTMRVGQVESTGTLAWRSPDDMPVGELSKVAETLCPISISEAANIVVEPASAAGTVGFFFAVTYAVPEGGSSDDLATANPVVTVGPNPASQVFSVIEDADVFLAMLYSDRKVEMEVQCTEGFAVLELERGFNPILMAVNILGDIPVLFAASAVDRDRFAWRLERTPIEEAFPFE